MKIRPSYFFITSVICFLASGYGLLWVFSSSSLAFIPCNGEYSFFHNEFRCRQPYYAFIMWVVFGVISLALFILGVKRIKQLRNEKNT